MPGVDGALPAAGHQHQRARGAFAWNPVHVQAHAVARLLQHEALAVGRPRGHKSYRSTLGGQPRGGVHGATARALAHHVTAHLLALGGQVRHAHEHVEV